MRPFIFVIASLTAFADLVAHPDYPYIVTARSGLVLRSAPSRNASGISLIPFGTRLRLYETHYPGETIDNVYGLWRLTRVDNDSGWVFGGFLSQIPPELRERAAEGEKCSLNEAMIEFALGDAWKATAFLSQIDSQVPCILATVDYPVNVRDIRVSRTGRWLVLAEGTTAQGTLTVFDLHSNSSVYYSSNYSTVKFTGDNEFTFVQSIRCKLGIQKKFSNGAITNERQVHDTAGCEV